ncbi:MAG: hypothetical protein ACOYYJ_14390 [Chloroflexota bacterium]
MKLQPRFVGVIVFLLLVASLVAPATVFADDSAPPPATEAPPVEETEAPPATEAPEVEETETPPVAATPIVVEPPASGQEMTTPEPASEDAGQLPAEIDATLPEILEEFPEGTEVVVLDENGEVEPLATNEAETALLTGDPVWCPAVLTAPTPGANGCTASYTSLQALLTYLDANEQAAAGVIWIESTYDSSVNDAVAGFTLNGVSFATMSNYALTIQGGWNGTSGSASVDHDAPSEFNGDYLNIVNWNANVTLNDILINGVAATGLQVDTTGNIEVSNVEITNNNGAGASLDNSSGNGDVEVRYSTFSQNAFDGLDVFSSGAVSLNNIAANGNGTGGVFGSGAYIDNTSAASDQPVYVGGGNVFNSNLDTGLVVYTRGEVNMNNTTASDSVTGSGAYINNTFAFLDSSVNLAGDNVFSNNSLNGLEVHSDGTVTIENVIAEGNGNRGLYIDAAGDAAVYCSHFENNLVGIYADLPGELATYTDTFASNGTDITLVGGGVRFDDPNYICVEDDQPVPSLQIVYVSSSDDTALFDCVAYTGTMLVLPGGDAVTFKCPIAGSATLEAFSAAALPGPLPAGVEFITGMESTHSPDGNDTALEGKVIVSFLLSGPLKDEDLAILYWNGTGWLDLDTAAFTDGRLVYDGGFETGDDRFEATINFSGVFALVKK